MLDIAWRVTSKRPHRFCVHCILIWTRAERWLPRFVLSRKRCALWSVQPSSSPFYVARMTHCRHNRMLSWEGGNFDNRLQHGDGHWQATLLRGWVHLVFFLALLHIISTSCQPSHHFMAVIRGLLLLTPRSTPSFLLFIEDIFRR